MKPILASTILLLLAGCLHSRSYGTYDQDQILVIILDHDSLVSSEFITHDNRLCLSRPKSPSKEWVSCKQGDPTRIREILQGAEEAYDSDCVDVMGRNIATVGYLGRAISTSPKPGSSKCGEDFLREFEATFSSAFVSYRGLGDW